MTEIFSTDIIINNNSVPYKVKFEDEAYVFISESSASHQQFSLSREHDEWVAKPDLPEEVKFQAVEALDKFLLKQH